MKRMEMCLIFLVLPAAGFAAEDLVSLDCEPVCQQELQFERQCAVERGCYSPEILSNDLLFIQCWQPCWESSNNCLKICRQEHSAIKDRCSKQCTDSKNTFCHGFCFAMAIDTLLRGTGEPEAPDNVTPSGALPPTPLPPGSSNEPPTGAPGHAQPPQPADAVVVNEQ